MKKEYSNLWWIEAIRHNQQEHVMRQLSSMGFSDVKRIYSQLSHHELFSKGQMFTFL